MKIKINSLSSKLENMSISNMIFYDEEVSDNEDTFADFMRKWKHNPCKEYKDIEKYLEISNKLKHKLLYEKYNSKLKKDFEFLFKKVYHKCLLYKKEVNFDVKDEIYKNVTPLFIEKLKRTKQNVHFIILKYKARKETRTFAFDMIEKFIDLFTTLLFFDGISIVDEVKNLVENLSTT